MIKNLIRKPLGKDSTYREGSVYCKLWDTEIPIMLFEEEVTLEYAEECADAMNSMSDELIDAICRAAKMYCIGFCNEICDEGREELQLAVPVDQSTPPREMLKCFMPTAMSVEPPKDDSKTGYQLECSCDWEEEHGMEIDILDGKLVFLSEFCGESPWTDHSDEEGNYAAHIYE